MATINLKVNGKNHQIEVAPDTPLLYVLRNHLRLNGPKYGCGMEQCGSCMVLIDNQAVPSCVRPCDGLSAAEIQTLEGVGTPEKPHPLQQAFIEEQAAQCGYCINGMIISAKALLHKNPKPTDEEIKHALQTVLCRCGTHARILRAVKRAAFEL